MSAAAEAPQKFVLDPAAARPSCADRTNPSDPLALKIDFRSVETLKSYAGNARTHSKKQIAQIAASIRRFGFVNPALIDREDRIIAGHGRVEAARLLGMGEVPTIRLEHLSEAERKAYVIADNRLAELAGWDREKLRIELQSLAELDLDLNLEITGFETAELDLLLDGEMDRRIDPRADAVVEPSCGHAVSRPGDVWLLGEHRLVCGNALEPADFALLMDGEAASMVFTDPPYNVPIAGHVSGLGETRHREFVMASGEMSRAEFTAFLSTVLANLAAVSTDGSIHFVCMDWRHMGEVLAAGAAAYAELKNLVVWAKSNGGMGAFYRSQHELVFVYKKGSAAHTNTFGLGQTGRYRTNVWSYPGVNTFRTGREDDLGMHPTVKPVSMVADAIKDVSRRGEIVLDAFGGSGTTLIAAQKTRRRARLLELDPLYVDVICRRWARFSGSAAVHAQTGLSFEALASERAAVPEAA